MVKRWVWGTAAVFVIVAVSGVGFAALTATATVQGTINAAPVSIQILAASSGGCQTNVAGLVVPTSIQIGAITGGGTALTVNVTDMILGVNCGIAVEIENTGPTPVQLTAGILFAGNNGICGAYQTSCYDVYTLSGIQSSGADCFGGSYVPCGTPTVESSDFLTLGPGQTFVDSIGVTTPPGSTSGTPSYGAFEIVYIGSETI